MKISDQDKQDLLVGATVVLIIVLALFYVFVIMGNSPQTRP